ncbi:MAG: ABC transporter ATP-binding protein [Polyangiaceae bacterium]
MTQIRPSYAPPYGQAQTHAASTPMPLLIGENLVQELGRGELRQRVLHGVSLAIQPSELVALTGTSGSGKSTLLYLMGALDKPTSGRVLYRGTDLTAMSDRDRAHFRGHSLGYIFQFHFLLAEYTVLENVSLPLVRCGIRTRQAEAAADEALELLGLSSLRARRPGQLSGGQQQRVAIARAIAHKPALVLADEPTGSLDARNAAAVFAALKHLTRAHHTAVLMVTHDPSLAASCDRTISLADGRITAETRNERRDASQRSLDDADTNEQLALALEGADAADAETIATDAIRADELDDWSGSTEFLHSRGPKNPKR